MDLVVEDEDQSTTGTSDDVREATLEESVGALLLEDGLEAMHGSLILGILLTGSHHESTSDGIKRVGGDTSDNGDDLGETPDGKDVGLLHIFEEQDFTGVEKTEVRSSIHDDTNDGNTETSVETLDTILSSAFLEAVNETIEFSILSGTDISSESGTAEIERVDDGEGSSTSSSTGGHVTHEEFDWLSLGVGLSHKDFLILILAGEVEGLSGEITDDVSGVTSPESTDTLFSADSVEAITNTIVSLFNGDVRVSILDLKEELDSLDRCDDGLRDGSRNTTDKEINQEVFLSHCYFV